MLELLRTRFHENVGRHPELDWQDVERRLRDDPAALDSLRRMEETGGEPDVLGVDADSGRIVFCD